MRRLAHHRLAALRDAPILFGAGAVALLADGLVLLVLWFGFLNHISMWELWAMPADLWAASLLAGGAVPVSIGTVLTASLFVSGLIFAAAAFGASKRRPNRTTRLPRVRFAVDALAAALLLGGGVVLLTVPGEAEFVRRAEVMAASGRDHEFVTLIDLRFPRAIAAARTRLSDSDPGIRFLYGAALQATGQGDSYSRQAMTEAVARLRELVRTDPTLYAPGGTLTGARFLNGRGLLGGRPGYGIPLAADLDPDGGRFWTWWAEVEPDYRAE